MEGSTGGGGGAGPGTSTGGLVTFPARDRLDSGSGSIISFGQTGTGNTGRGELIESRSNVVGYEAGNSDRLEGFLWCYSLGHDTVSLIMSVAVKANGDLLSEVLPDESGEDEILLLQAVTRQNGQMQSAVEAVRGAEPANNAWHPIPATVIVDADGSDVAVLEKRPERDVDVESFSLKPHSEGTFGSRFHLGQAAPRADHFAMADGSW